MCKTALLDFVPRLNYNFYKITFQKLDPAFVIRERGQKSYHQDLIALMMEAVSTYETSVNLYHTTRRNIPENSHLHIRRRENLKSHR
jgi:hypothetical protein